MNIIYTKTLLYVYGVADSVIEQLDDLAMRKALTSISDFSPCIEQCEKIINLTNQKNIILEIKENISKILSKLTIYQQDLLDYKYFKKKPKDYYKNFDFSSRAYFRSQVKVVSIVSEKLEKYDINDNWFEENCLDIQFFKEMLNRVKEKELLSNKNKPNNVKNAQKNHHNSEFCSKFPLNNRRSVSDKLVSVSNVEKDNNSGQTA